MLYFIFNIHVRINPFKETQLETIDSKASKRACDYKMAY